MENTGAAGAKKAGTRVSARYNGGLDFWKLVFTLVIVTYHGGQIGDGDNPLGLGASAVEFFFILSGYFMAVSAARKPQVVPGTLGSETAHFILHKIKSLLPYYLFGYALSLVGYCYIELPKASSGQTLVEKLGGIIPNFFLLSTTGIKESTVLGMSWYISAMLLSMCVLYPLLRKYTNMYLRIIAPLSAVLLAGYLYQKYGALTLTYELDVFVTKEILRAVMGLNIGCAVYVVSEKLKQTSFTSFSRLLLGFFEWGCYAVVLLGMHYMGNSFVFTELFLYFFALCVTTSKQSLWGHVFDHRCVQMTNRFSLALYLCHSACRRVIRYVQPAWGYYETILYFVILSLILALFCMGVAKLCQVWWKHHGAQVKKAFVRTAL